MKTKTLTIGIAVLAAIALFFMLTKNKKENGQEVQIAETVMLFNGTDLLNWEFFLRGDSVDPATVFSVKDGIISITGEPFGYMRTKEKYSDYTLHVEWRWPDEPTNSGVFIHGQEPDAIWLQCIECQLQHGNAGDFICMNGADIEERTDKSRIVVRKMAESSEKAAGEWNTMEVTCDGNTIEVSVNGVLQNRGTGSNISSGFICLQSEGKEIQFRNVYLTKLKK
jgi:hypothetical protein